VAALVQLLREERERSNRAEAAAALYQKRLRHVEAELERVRAVAGPAWSPRPWWLSWRRS
jgi:hypothetical protein